MRCPRCGDAVLPSEPGCGRCGHLDDRAFAGAVEASRAVRATERRRAVGWLGVMAAVIALYPVGVLVWWSWVGEPPSRWPRLVDLPIHAALVAVAAGATIAGTRARDAFDRSRIRQHLPPRREDVATLVPAPPVRVERR